MHDYGETDDGAALPPDGVDRRAESLSDLLAGSFAVRRSRDRDRKQVTEAIAEARLAALHP